MKDAKVTLLYPPEQTWPDTMCKPNGSLAYPMLGGALMKAGIDVKVFDACVGNERDDLNEVFYNSSPLPSGMLRTGVSNERILEEVADCDVVGMTSIFSHQETMVLETAKLIKRHYPEKLLISGGVNARNRLNRFFSAGFDIVCLSEAENTIVDICKLFEKGVSDFSSVQKISFLKDGKRITNNLGGDIVWNLDELPIPAWHLLPNERYWKIGRPHGGHFEDHEELKYASMVAI